MTTDDTSAVRAREIADRLVTRWEYRTRTAAGIYRDELVEWIADALTAHGEAIRAEMQASSVTALHRVQVELEAFDALAEEWHADTDHLSVTWQKALHESYQQIIGMGPAAVPHILRHLRTRGGKWLWALRAIARADVSEGASDKEAVVRAWEAWARRRGLV